MNAFATEPTTDARRLASLRGAVARTGIARSRLDHAIKTGQIDVFYTGLRAVKVDLADVERLLKTPPSKAAPTPQQAAVTA